MMTDLPASARLAGRRAWLAALTVAVCVTALLAVTQGAMPIPVGAVWQVLTGQGAELDGLTRQIVWDVRMPRVLLALLAGAALALTGATMQALFRNPLAEPGLIGVSAGGALGAVAAIVWGAGSVWVLAPAAFVGSMVATTLAYALGRRMAGVAGLLLAGVAINTIAGSVIGLLTLMANDAQLRDLTFWSMGSLANASWNALSGLAPWILLCCIGVAGHWRVLNALLLGERETQHLGWAVARVRLRLIVLTALIVGPLVAVTGGIAFVGLIVPHVVRLALGADHRLLLPASMLTGALALTLADWICRVALAPAELPIGLVTSLIGGPFFIWLLMRARRI